MKNSQNKILFVSVLNIYDTPQWPFVLYYATFQKYSLHLSWNRRHYCLFTLHIGLLFHNSIVKKLNNLKSIWIAASLLKQLWTKLISETREHVSTFFSWSTLFHVIHLKVILISDVNLINSFSVDCYENMPVHFENRRNLTSREMVRKCLKFKK